MDREHSCFTLVERSGKLQSLYSKQNQMSFKQWIGSIYGREWFGGKWKYMPTK